MDIKRFSNSFFPSGLKLKTTFLLLFKHVILHFVYKLRHRTQGIARFRVFITKYRYGRFCSALPQCIVREQAVVLSTGCSVPNVKNVKYVVLRIILQLRPVACLPGRVGRFENPPTKDLGRVDVVTRLPLLLFLKLQFS